MIVLLTYGRTNHLPSRPDTDGFHRVSIERLRSVLGSRVKRDKEKEQEDATVDERLDALTHYTCLSLPHLIALLCRPTPSCIPQDTSLIVVDSLSALVNHTFPRTPEQKKIVDSKGNKGTFSPPAKHGVGLTVSKFHLFPLGGCKYCSTSSAHFRNLPPRET